MKKIKIFLSCMGIISISAISIPILVACSSSKPQNNITYSVTINGQDRIAINTESRYVANISPNLDNAFYDWSTSTNENIQLSHNNSNVANITSSIAQEIILVVKVYNDASKQELIARKDKTIIFVNNSNSGSALNPDGGQLSSDQNLSADKYKIIVDKLNLKQNDLLTNLNDISLNELLHKDNLYANLNLSIANDSSTHLGVLNLQLQGKYNNEDIDTIITISGFNCINKDNSSIYFESIDINNANWFNEMLPIKTSSNQDKLKINSLTADKIKSVLLSENTNIVISDNLKININEINDQFNLDLSFDYNNQTDSIDLAISGTYQNKIYKNGVWINDEEQLINLNPKPSTGIQNISFLTKDNLYSFMLDNLQINEVEINNKYPSYFLGSANLAKYNNTNMYVSGLFVNDNEIINKFKASYYPNNTVSFFIDKDTVRANDFNGTLEFNVKVFNDDGFNQSVIFKTFSYSDLKTILDFVNNQTLSNDINIKDGSTLYNSLDRILVKSILKDKIEELRLKNVGESITVELNKQDVPSFRLNTVDVYNQEKIIDDEQINYFNTLSENIQPMLFNQILNVIEKGSISSDDAYSLNIASNLYNNKDKMLFVINNIYYEIPGDIITIKLTKRSSTRYTIDIGCITVVEFSENQQRQFNSNYYMSCNF